LLVIDRLAPEYHAGQDWWHRDLNERVEKGMVVCKDLLRQLIAEK
jgi:hypothetical protein